MGISQQYVQDHGDLLLPGLDSQQTYVALRQNKTQGLNVAIRPQVQRDGSQTVLFGGKFRVGYTMNPDHSIVKTKVEALNDDARAANIREFCKGFKWIMADQRRCSTILGFSLAGGKYDKEAVIEALVEGGLALEFVNSIEAKYKQYNDVGFQNKRKAAAAIEAAWLIQLESYFRVIPETTLLPEDVVGTRSKLLNQAQGTYSDNVVSFQKAVAEKAAANSE